MLSQFRLKIFSFSSKSTGTVSVPVTIRITNVDFCEFCKIDLKLQISFRIKNVDPQLLITGTIISHRKTDKGLKIISVSYTGTITWEQAATRLRPSPAEGSLRMRVSAAAASSRAELHRNMPFNDRSLLLNRPGSCNPKGPESLIPVPVHDNDSRYYVPVPVPIPVSLNDSNTQKSQSLNSPEPKKGRLRKYELWQKNISTGTKSLPLYRLTS